MKIILPNRDSTLNFLMLSQDYQARDHQSQTVVLAIQNFITLIRPGILGRLSSSTILLWVALEASLFLTLLTHFVSAAHLK